MASKLFLIYFYFTFNKNSLNATLNNKLNLNKTKLKLKKKVNLKFKSVGPFSFFFPRFFIFFPSHCSSSSLTHIHRRRTPPFRVLFFFLLLQWPPNKHQQWPPKRQWSHPLPRLRPFNINPAQWKNRQSIPQLLQVNRKPMSRSRGLSSRSWKR